MPIAPPTTTMDTMRERFTTPQPRRAATSRLNDIREHMKRDIGLALFPALAHDVDIYAAIWALLRETMLAGPGTRVDKEIVAAAVSVANRCAYCVAAHTTFLHAAGQHDIADDLWNDQPPRDPSHAALVDWGGNTRRPTPNPAPFDDDHAPGIIGTAVTFHFVNRMISALMDDDLLPAGLQRSRTVRRLTGTALGSITRRTHEPGTSIRHLGPARAPHAPSWTGNGPIHEAYRALAAATRADDLLSPTARHLIHRAVTDLAGQHPPPGAPTDRTLAELPADERPGAEIALLAATAGNRITQDHIAQWRHGHDDADLVRLVAGGVMISVAPIATTLDFA